MAKLSDIYDKYSNEDHKTLNAIKKLRRKLISENTGRKPLTGTYYWVPRPEGGGRWDLEYFLDQEFGDTSHNVMWYKFVIPYLAETWDLDVRSVRRRLRDKYTAFPRGRVVQGRDNFVVYHGNNFTRRGWENKIKRAFNLRKMNVKFAFDPHERVIQNDLVSVQRLLGREFMTISAVDPSTDQYFAILNDEINWANQGDKNNG